MLSEYIDLVESFKKNQISRLIETINLKIFDALNSPKFNPRIAPYFSTVNKTGVPFTDFSLDPDNISQIKKIINALYHARLAFVDLENVDLRNTNRTLSDLLLLYKKTIHEAYEASYLLTHLDVDINDMFSEEFALIIPVINQFKTIAENNKANTHEIAEKLKTFPISYKAGEVTGIAIEQIQPNSGDLDYDFLTTFSAALPSYIDKVTQYISQYSSRLIEKEPLSKEKIEELQNAAFKLLNDLENLKGNSLFLSLKVLNYIHIVRNIITLSMSSLEEMGNLSDSSQDVIRDNLAQLKYSLLPNLFGLVDKIEDNTMLKPGMLSIRLMEKIKPLYELLIFYASKPVNFQEKGEELLSIEDSRFLALRLERTYKRIDSANKSLFKIKKAEEALYDFYEILDDPRFKDAAIHQLPEETKEQLIRHYKIIKPYMSQKDINFNEQLINSLQGPENWSSFLATPWRWIKREKPADHISIVLEKKMMLHDLISKKRATEQFHIDLNMDLINSVHKQTNLILFPYSDKTNIFNIDESTALNTNNGTNTGLTFKQEKEHNILANPDKLTADQALDLYQWYRNKHNKFIVARNAYNDFINLLNQQPETTGDILYIDKLGEDIKAKCRNLYNIFQPYFINGMPQELTESALNFDTYLVHALSNKTQLSNAPPVNMFAKMDEHFQSYFTQIDLNWNKKSRAYLKWSQDKFQNENDATPLVYEKNVENRANHLIPHTNYSKFVKEFKAALFETTRVFNDAMRAELTPQQHRNSYPKPTTSVEELIIAFNQLIDDEINEIPFPELEDPNQILTQSKQVLAIKQIFNSLYHVEGIILQLENLTHNQSESIYVCHLLQAYGHINEIMKLTKSLATDPHFSIIGRELLNKAQTFLATIQAQSNAYQVSPDELGTEETVGYNGLWYSLNTFFIIPKHIRALNNSNYLTTEELDELHLSAKNSAIRIENIIKASSSYFQMFLQTPNMYRLYRDLTSKLNEFISTSHDTMMSNLGTFKSGCITPMLLEADLWEDKLGLKPGTLSDTLKTITDEYYKGLLHPFALHSKIHLGLVCDKAPIEKRINETNEKINNANNNLAKLEKSYKHIERLYQLIDSYNNFTNGLLPASALITEHTRKVLLETYPKALPKLVKLKKKLDIPPSKNQEDFKLDTLLNSTIKKYEPKLSQIITLVTASHHFYLGKKATCEMQLNTAKEKLIYLDDLSTAQDKTNLLFIEEYTTESFNKQMEALSNRHIGLQYTYKEYRQKLKTYLLTFKDQIINESKTAEDVNLTVRNALKDKISLFEKEYFAKHYHLDTVRVALAQFQNYFIFSNAAIENNNSLFENEKTLEKKSEYINRFIEIAENENLSIEERLDQIKTNIKNPNFERIIFTYKQADYFSFAYLRQCILSLFETLHLYTPERKTIYHNLSNAVNNPPQISELTKRFGLFAASSHKVPPAEPVEDEAELNNMQESFQMPPEEQQKEEKKKDMLFFMKQMREHANKANPHENPWNEAAFKTS